MSFLSDVVQKVGGELGAGSGSGDLMTSALQLLENAQGGGLPGLLQQFQQHGLGEAVASWIGTGANLPISAEQLQRVLGSDRLQAIAAQAGVSHGEASGQLAQLLPQLIDQLTPHGALPQGGLLTEGLSLLRGKIGV